jgi:hypothetical protein
MSFFGVLFLYLSASTPSEGTYILNPYLDPQAISGTPLSKSLESVWLRAFYKKVQLVGASNRTQLKDFEGESLDQKIRLATQDYLQSSLEEAREKISQAEKLVVNSPLYAQFETDLMEVLALRLMISGPELNLEALPENVKPLTSKTEFLNKLPLKWQAKIQNLSKSKPILIKELDGRKCDRLFLNGREVSLPTSLLHGSYVVHCLKGPDLEAYRAEVSTSDLRIHEVFWSKSIFEILPISSLENAFSKSRPQELKNAGISVWTKDKRILPIASRVESLRPLPHTDPLENPLGEFKDQSEASVLFRSPWLWIVVGAAIAGTTGYFIYDSVQTKTARGP